MDPSPTEEPAVASPVVPRQRSELTPLVPSTPPAEVVRRTASGSPWPMRLAILVGVVALLCVGGLGVAFHLYDKATKPDRSTPDVVVDNYLQAFLVNRNDTDANQYVCTDASRLAAFQTFRNQVEAREQSIGSHIGISWGSLVVAQRTSNTATVTVTLTESATVNGTFERLSSEWAFVDLHSSDWRVCGATHIS